LRLAAQDEAGLKNGQPPIIWLAAQILAVRLNSAHQNGPDAGKPAGLVPGFIASSSLKLSFA